MNWEDIEKSPETQKLLSHWQKLGQFRRNHPSVGAGIHQMISEAPYLFSRTYSGPDFSDLVVVGLDLEMGPKALKIGDAFENGTQLRDAYSGLESTVSNGMIELDTPFSIVLLEKI
jgi:alpha-amylase